MAVMEGPLSKWTNVMKGWQYRWFVLDDNTGLLSYYTSKEKMVRGTRRGCVRLKGAVIGIDDEDDSTFTITVDGKIFHFQARDAEEREKWVHSLEETILRHTHTRHPLKHKWNQLCLPPTIQDFDQKLTESDSYLQLLIDQVKDLEAQIEQLEDEREKRALIVVRDRANALLETIKHSIVLLQITKNTTHPMNGVYQPFKEPLRMDPTLSQDSPEVILGPDGKGTHDPFQNSASIPSNPPMPWPTGMAERQRELGKDGAVGPVCAIGELNDSGTLSSSQVASFTIDDAEKSNPFTSSVVSATTSVPHITLPVPETSYSSSDDDDFFDAAEDAAAVPQSPNGQKTFEDAVEEVQHELSLTSSQRLRDWNSVGYDAVYEDDDEEDLGSLEGQGSVLSHLLSQVKIGMDLTKVVLPTFILERRSLLEMYADFFAHPDVFVSIADFSDAKDRMVQVVRWYLSAFHAGRKSSVAKKPYNPILGEIFRCYWETPGEESVQTTVEDGPVPWAGKNNLSFMAEQVSHHPPISAFYAEHYEKKITCCAHIWTKSKFLGLSIGVHNIGQGCVSLIKYDEEYIITFPNGYGRSILTVPWIELGGEVTISCAKTGYLANIQFLHKPFYGGKKHRISANVFQPNDKKPFLTIEGEWNGFMNAKWSSGKTEVFVDTRTIPIVRKKVKPIVQQELYESRRLWKDVTMALKVKNVVAATEAKFAIEQKQRDAARQRQERATKWDTRVFHEVGEHWVYDNPLQKRLKINT